MGVECKVREEDSIVDVTISGKLTKQDYEQFVPELENLIQKHGKMRMLCRLSDFHGWHMGAMWEDLKFDVKHFRDIDRLAIVGENKWQEWISKFSSAFTGAAMKYFSHDQADEAEAWIHADEESVLRH